MSLKRRTTSCSFTRVLISVQPIPGGLLACKKVDTLMRLCQKQKRSSASKTHEQQANNGNGGNSYAPTRLQEDGHPLMHLRRKQNRAAPQHDMSTTNEPTTLHTALLIIPTPHAPAGRWTP